MVTSDVSGLHAIRKGKWKYIDNTLPEGLPESKYKFIELEMKDGVFQPALYNLETDPSEQRNVLDNYPEVVTELKNELKRLRKSHPDRYSQ